MSQNRTNSVDGPRDGFSRGLFWVGVVVGAVGLVMLVGHGQDTPSTIMVVQGLFLGAIGYFGHRPPWRLRGDRLLFPAMLGSRSQELRASDVVGIERVVTSARGRPEAATYNLILRNGFVRCLAVRDLGPDRHSRGHSTEPFFERSAFALAVALGLTVTERQEPVHS